MRAPSEEAPHTGLAETDWLLRIVTCAPAGTRRRALAHARELALAGAHREALCRIDLLGRALKGETAAVLSDLEAHLAASAGPPGATQGTTEALEAEFRRNLAVWRADCEFTSSMTKILLHPSYQRIIGLGRAVVPLLLRELETEPSHLGWALQAITGVNPVPAEDAGRLDRITRAWIRWGRERGLLP